MLKDVCTYFVEYLHGGQTIQDLAEFARSRYTVQVRLTISWSVVSDYSKVMLFQSGEAPTCSNNQGDLEI